MMRAATIVVMLAAFAVPARASGDAAAADRPGRALFEQAEAKFNVGRFDEALADYQAAYDAEPLPAFLFNIGQCYRNMGNYDRAQFFFRRYAVLDPHSPNRRAAERLIAEMDKLVDQRDGAGAREQAPPLLPPPAATGERAATSAPAAFVAQPVRAAPAATPVYRRAWFWVTLSAVVVGGVVAAYALAPDDPRSSLRPIDAR